MAEGVITQDERTLLEELRTLTLETITVDDFDPEELRSAGYYKREQKGAQSQAA